MLRVCGVVDLTLGMPSGSGAFRGTAKTTQPNLRSTEPAAGPRRERRAGSGSTQANRIEGLNTALPTRGCLALARDSGNKPWGIEQEGVGAPHQHPRAHGRGMGAAHGRAPTDLDPRPKAIYVPSQVTGGTQTDADMLKIVWQSVVDLGIPILNPR